MEEVYVVEHSHELDDCDETKMIGVFSTKHEAGKAVEKAKKLSGFKDYPNDFYIEEEMLKM